MSAPDAIVIGAGLAGLTAGAILARAGWTVQIFEQHGVAGGLLQSFHRGNCRFETGFHFISDAGPGGCARRICDHLGILPRLRFLPPDPAAAFVVHAADHPPLALPVGLERVEATLMQAFPTSAPGIHRLWTLVRQSLGAKPWLAHLGLPGGQADEAIALSAVLDACAITGMARQAIVRLSGLVGIDQDCRFFAFAYIVGSAFSGAWRLAGGGNALIQALQEAIREAGGEIHLRRDIVRIHHAGRDITGLEDAAGTIHRAEVYVASCHPTELIRLAGDEAFRPGFLNAVKDRPDGPGSFSIHASLRRHLPVLGTSQHLLQDAEGGSTYLVAPGNFEPEETPTLELVHWMPVAALAPWATSTLGQRPATYTAWKERQADRLLALIDPLLPGVVETITQRWTCTPLTFRDYTRTRGGAALGFSQGTASPAEPIAIRGKLRNCFLVGQNLMLPGILGTLIGTTDTVGRMVGIDPIKVVMGR